MNTATRRVMRRVVLTVALLATLAVVPVAVALASGGGSGFTALGPFSGSQISVSGSCGNVYAIIRNTKTSYRVFPQKADGSFVVEQFFRGDGRTQAGSSPEACLTGSGATVAAGIRVSFDDLQMEVITGGAFDPSASCSSPCFFRQFVPSFFGPAAVVRQISAVDTQSSACNGTVIDNGFAGAFAGDITGLPTACSGGGED